MTKNGSSSAAFAVPVIGAMLTVSVLNGLWSLPSLGLDRKLPHALGVYLPSALVALGLLWWVLRRGLVTTRDVGLDIGGWSAPRRTFALVLVLAMGFGGYATLQLPPESSANSVDGTVAGDGSDHRASGEVAEKPAWGDYCFWFVFLLSASLVELLVFVCIGFCLPEKWLREKLGWPAAAATVFSAVFAAFMFGIYHYTHEPRFWDYVYFPLMPVMLLNLVCFVATRNIHLTLLLHNCFAAVGFTQEQWIERARDVPAEHFEVSFFLNPESPMLPALIVSFVVPYLLLLWIEFQHQRATRK